MLYIILIVIVIIAVVKGYKYYEQKKQEREAAADRYYEEERKREEEHKRYLQSQAREISDRRRARETLQRKNQKLTEPNKFLGNCKLAYYYSDVDVDVIGTIDPYCQINVLCKLIPEPNNPNDSNAVKVVTIKNDVLGYLCKGKLQKMVRNFQRRDEEIISRVSLVDFANNKLQIAMAFYKKFTEDDMEKTFTVSVSEKKYDEQFTYDIGDDINVDYDSDKGSYTIAYLAKLPDKYEEYADGDHTFIILDDEEKDSGAHSITIGIVNTSE